MTTTTRKSPRKAAPKGGDVRAESLAKFSATLDRHAGFKVGFAAMVRELFVTRVQLAQIKAARTAVFDHVKHAYEVGHRVVGENGYEIAMTAPGEAVAYRAVESAAVRKAHPAAWRAAQSFVPYVQVKAPASAQQRASGGLAVALPEAVEFLAPAEAVVLYREHPAWALARSLRAVETEVLAQLDKVAAEFGWDGDLKVFSDGWSIQLRRLQFSADKLALTHPEVYEQMAVSKVRQAPARCYVRKVDGSEDGEGIWDA